MNFIFPYIGNFIIPTDELIFFGGVGQPPTSNHLQPKKSSTSTYIIYNNPMIATNLDLLPIYIYITWLQMVIHWLQMVIHHRFFFFEIFSQTPGQVENYFTKPLELMLKNFTQLLSFQKSRCTRPLNPESVPGPGWFGTVGPGGGSLLLRPKMAFFFFFRKKTWDTLEI